MQGISGGSVVWILDADTGQFTKALLQAETQAKTVAKNIESGAGASFANFASKAGSSFDGVANSIASLAKVSVALLAGGAFGVGAFVNQASELQSIRASFEAMTGSAGEATKVLQQLNKFSFETAFSSQAINAAARTFLGAGLEVDKLGTVLSQVGDIAGATGADLGRLTLPLSQAMARGKLQTQDFYQILDSGAGKLGQQLRKELADRGMGDFMKAMEEGKVSSQVLFDVIAKSAAEGGFAFQGALKQSKTFAGQMSNLQETVGNVALEILGVNKATGEIDPNGVFAKISLAVQDATKWLNENKTQIKDVAMVLINNAVPGVTALVAAFTVAKVAAIGFSIAAGIAAGTISLPFLLAAVLITALVAALTFLQVKFDIFGKGIQWVKDAFQGLYDLVVKGDFTGALGRAFNIREDNPIVNFVLKARDAMIGLATNVKDTIGKIAGWFNDNKTAIINTAIIIGTLFIPKLIQVGIQGTIALGKLIAGFALAGAQAVVAAAKTSVAFVASSIATMASWGPALVTLIGGFVMAGVQALIAGARIAASWLMALGPIGLIIAAVIGIAALVIANWSAISTFFVGLWKGIVNVFNGFVDFIKKWGLLILAVMFLPFTLVVLGIMAIWQPLTAFFTGLWNGIIAVFNAVSGPIVAVFNGIMYVLNAVWTIFSTIFTGIAQIVWTVVSTIVQIIGVVLYGTFLWLWNNILTPTYNFFVTIFTAIWTTIVTIVTAIVTAIVQYFTAVWNFYVTIFTAIWTFISGVFTAIWNTIVSIATAIWTSIVAIFTAVYNFFASIFSAIWNTVSSIVNAIWNTIVSVFNAIWNTIRNIVTGIFNSVRDTFNNVRNAVSDGIQSAYNTVTGFVGRFLEAGRNIIDGIVKGITGGKDMVVNKVKEIASGALDAIKNFFGIHSPSRVMADMGKYLMQGFGNGISDNASMAVKAALSASDAIMGSFGSIDGSTFDVQANANLGGTIAPITSHDYAAADNTTKMFEYQIGSITIGSEVDGEAWLQKLTQNQEIISQGLTPMERLK